MNRAPFRTGRLLTDRARLILASILVVALALMAAGATLDGGAEPLAPNPAIRSR